ncbi:TonB-dependent receptor [Fulvitalea axinellae]|uniref:TonB-dependent receptor n=1 Tax=Fulvitalea axinellae TaxID=1182444 RepID=UPI0030CA52EE
MSRILNSFHERYGVQSSYDYRLISKHLVSDSATYSSPEIAVQSMLKGSQLDYRLIDSVFVLFAKPLETTIESEEIKQDTVVRKAYYFSGQVTDGISGEPLPYSSIRVGEKGYSTDVNGHYSFKTETESERLEISYLGYYMLDTLLLAGTKRKIELTPSLIGLEEIVVLPDLKLAEAHIGAKPALIKLNHQVASFLPGNNSNTLFNLLRLQPGILAASEQSADYSVWGGYRGHTLLSFDGIPLFSAASHSNEIGIVNPLMIQDVEVLKAGYEPHKGDRVGGVIRMSGKMGNAKRFRAQANVNSQTVSASVNIPFAEKYALQLALRQSYYNIVDWNELFAEEADDNRDFFTPDFNFRDMNLKFSGRMDNGDNFFVSLLANQDKVESMVIRPIRRGNESRENLTDKKGFGIGGNYVRNWHRAGVSEVGFAYSGLNTNAVDKIRENPRNAALKFFEAVRENGIEEFSIYAEHRLPVLGRHGLTAGIKAIRNTASFVADASDATPESRENNGSRFSYYIKDDIKIGEKIGISPGLKWDYLAYTKKAYLSPRIAGYWEPELSWRVNASWGIYSQYISEVAFADDFRNFFYAWQLNGILDNPVLRSEHYTLGLSYRQEGFSVSAEGFYKMTDGLKRTYFIPEDKRHFDAEAISRAYGIDFYIQKKISKHDFWVAYTLSKVEERYPEFRNEYHYAPHNQLHELKTAAVFDFRPFYFSANYVYGSGLRVSQKFGGGETVPYNRLDVALLYRFGMEKLDIEAGASVLNLTNADNVANSNVSNLPSGRAVYLRGVPFTPGLFVKVGI